MCTEIVALYSIPSDVSYLHYTEQCTMAALKQCTVTHASVFCSGEFWYFNTLSLLIDMFYFTLSSCNYCKIAVKVRNWNKMIYFMLGFCAVCPLLWIWYHTYLLYHGQAIIMQVWHQETWERNILNLWMIYVHKFATSIHIIMAVFQVNQGYIFQSVLFLHQFQKTTVPSVLWPFWLGGSKGIWPAKTECWGTGMVICLERVQMICISSSWCHCHATISCSSKI